MAESKKQRQQTTPKEELKAESPDSGLEESQSILEDLDSLNISKNTDSFEEDAKEKANKNTPVVKDGKVRPDRPYSVSSENSSPGGGVWEISPISQSQSRKERVAVITELLETYFSDSYLTRDIFLLKHVKKSKEGWISMRFVATYKRIKGNAESLAEVEEACRASPMLDVNEDGSKVRRLAKLPDCIEKYIPTRIAVAGGLPEPMRNLTVLDKAMGVFGPIASIQILRPGGVLPAALRETANALPQLRNQWCVMVEYEEMSSAGKMVSKVNEQKDKKDSERDQPSPSWAVELIKSWTKRDNNDSNETLWFDGKTLCSSCPSSGYSSPTQSPDNSPALVGSCRGVMKGFTKRERVLMGRNNPQHSHQSCHFHSHSQSPKCYHRHMQHCGSPHSSPCCDHSSSRRYFSPQCSPRRTFSNWRTVAAN